MTELASIFKEQRFKLTAEIDGSIKIVRDMDKLPEYDDRVDYDDFFHWPSFAIREACLEVFRKDSDTVASHFQKAFEEESQSAETDMSKRVMKAVRAGCGRARACKASQKMRA